MNNVELLRTSEEFNPFGEALHACLAGRSSVLCTLRNGLKVDVVFQPADNERDTNGSFRSPDHSFYWKLDGKSLKNHDYDLIEF